MKNKILALKHQLEEAIKESVHKDTMIAKETEKSRIAQNEMKRMELKFLNPNLRKQEVS
jgi:hypothetical protein